MIFSVTGTDYVCKDDILMDRTLDLCKINDNAYTSLMFGWFFSAVKNNINFPLKCPYNSKIYEVKNSIIRFFAVNAIWKIYKGFFCVKTEILVKTPRSRSFINAYEFGARGHIEM